MDATFAAKKLETQVGSDGAKRLMAKMDQKIDEVFGSNFDPVVEDNKNLMERLERL